MTSHKHFLSIPTQYSLSDLQNSLRILQDDNTTTSSDTVEVFRPSAYLSGGEYSTSVLSGVGAFIACVTLFLFLTSVYLAWRVYVKGKRRFDKGVKL